LDNVVPVTRSEQMVNALKAYNPSVKFTEYPDLYHNSWERTYNNDSVYTWLLAHKKFHYTEIKSTAQQLNGFAGAFVGEHGDTIVMNVDTLGLHAKAHDNTFLLKSVGDNEFFINEHIPADLKFIRSANGKFDSFEVYEEEKTLYRKIK
ncbi:MAG: hypothetical protein JST96_12335, partial [Bacteroidetes bacterium]|nr:hypothetical protein [Bacteroidota bacterium]